MVISTTLNVGIYAVRGIRARRADPTLALAQ
jgi:hypothetical protein